MKFGSYQFSGAAMMISGALHIIPAIFAPSLFSFLVAVIYLGFGLLLFRQKSWAAWFVFLLSAFGVAGAIFGIYGNIGWLYWLILLADLVAATSTFWLIWKRP